MKLTQTKAKILSQNKIKGNYWHCELSAAQIAKSALPGQFINIRVNDGYEPLLRRPISIHGVSGTRIKIFYEVVGKATAILAQRKKGESLDIIGPLGNGFSSLGSQPAMIVAGGMGVAPLTFLAEKLREIQTPNSKLQTIVLIGARTKDQLLCVRDFKDLGCDVKVATDDGSGGFKGKVTDLLKEVLPANRQTGKPAHQIYACGPKPMLKAVADFSYERGIPAQLSLEEHMSCGIGACLGCAVKTKAGLKRVCKEGPVFFAKDLAW